MRAKTNSMRVLESRSIAYEAFEFSPDVRSAEEAARAMAAPIHQVFKTLVVLRERGRPLLVMVPGDSELDLKLLARASGEKKLRMAARREAEELTGLEVGGISAIALLNKGFDVYADESLAALKRVYVSAGARGINLCLGPGDLIQVTQAHIAPVAAPRPEESPPE
jgi:Cys-tRNA(Pro)/Cys-tRNA(Cys) deacylase